MALREWIALLHPDDRPAVQARLAEIMSTSGDDEWRAEFRAVKPDGSPTWVYAVGHARRDRDGHVTELIGFNLDVTKRKLDEIALANARRVEAVGKIAGGMAHDFNNLLAVIAGNLELAVDKVEDTATRDLLRRALEATEMGASFNGRLLSLVRRRKHEPKRLDLNARVTATCKLLERFLGERVRLSAELAADLPQIFADPGEIDSALLNLAANARDAMPDGGRILISTASEAIDEGRARRLGGEARPGLYVRMTVADDGSGMSAETLARATEPLFSTKESVQGSGLGLSSVESLAREAGGFLSIESEPRRGCAVNLWLPPAPDEADARRPPTAPTARLRARASSCSSSRTTTPSAR